MLDEFGDRMAVGELYLPTQRDLAAYVTSGDELHMAHNFFLIAAPWDAAAYRADIAEWQELLEPDAWPAWCLGNHDHPRLASRLGAARARVAAMLLVTLRGTPFLYQGDELGLRDVPVAPEAVVDVDGRDPERAPIPWLAPSLAGPGAGFTTGTPWLPITTGRRAAQRGDAGRRPGLDAVAVPRAAAPAARRRRRCAPAPSAGCTRAPTCSPTSAGRGSSSR